MESADEGWDDGRVLGSGVVGDAVGVEESDRVGAWDGSDVGVFDGSKDG